jgi:hypothetical protein
VRVATAVRNEEAVPEATPYPQSQARLEEYARRLS